LDLNLAAAAIVAAAAAAAGASGFGTPVALAAPMLASLGHAPINTVVCLLIMNTLATQFGELAGPVYIAK
jgi:lactate permease